MRRWPLCFTWSRGAARMWVCSRAGGVHARRDVALEHSPAVYASLLGAGHRRGPDAWRVATAAADGLCDVLSRAQVGGWVDTHRAALNPVTSKRGSQVGAALRCAPTRNAASIKPKF